jgi:hypothetical protein
MQKLGGVVEFLCGEYAALESDDLRDLRGGWRRIGLCMPESGIGCLAWVGSRPSHMIVERKPRLVAGSGRRHIDMMPDVGLVSPVAGFVVQPYGSVTLVTVNCEPAGSGRPIRIRPFFSNSL